MNEAQSIEFLGIGGPGAEDDPAAVVQFADGSRLLIDCGPTVLDQYLNKFAELPRAIYLTHCHLDHIGGLEALFYRLLDQPQQPKLFVAASQVALLHQRLTTGRYQLAEGGRNYWDLLQLVPVSDGFWFAERWFDIFAARHHGPGFCHGLRLPGTFVFTGDTRPIPELLNHTHMDELIFHDAQLGIGNPSHAGAGELRHLYDARVQERMWLYHYGLPTAGDALERQGFQVARSDCPLPFSEFLERWPLAS